EGATVLAGEIAMVLTERGLGGDDVDLGHRLETFRRDRSPRAADARRMAERWAGMAASPDRTARPEWGLGALLALAYPDRTPRRRDNGSFLPATGRGASLEATSPLAREPFLTVAELAGTAAQGRILLAAPIALADIEARFADSIESRDELTFDPA